MAELLIVCVIVAVLAGLVTTAAIFVKRRGKAAACGSNLGQIGKAMLGYAADNDDRVPPYMTSDNIDPRTYPIPMTNSEAWVAELGVYGASKEVFRCPADSHFGTADVDGAGASFRVTSYSTCIYVGMGYPRKGGGSTSSVSEIDEPSYRVYAADKAMYKPRDLGGGQWQPIYYTSHDLMYNAVCMDGRVVYGRADHSDGKFGQY